MGRLHSQHPQISERQCELKKKLKVTFVGEPGLDMGGLTKEWFMLITRHILLPDFGGSDGVVEMVKGMVRRMVKK